MVTEEPPEPVDAEDLEEALRVLRIEQAPESILRAVAAIPRRQA